MTCSVLLLVLCGLVKIPAISTCSPRNPSGYGGFPLFARGSWTCGVCLEVCLCVSKCLVLRPLRPRSAHGKVGVMGRRSFGRVEALPSGRYRARYQNPLKKSERIGAPQTFRTKTAARAWLNRVDASIGDGTWEHPSVVDAKRAAQAAEEAAERARKQVTVGGWVDAWLADLEASVESGGVAYGTFRTYRSNIQTFLADHKQTLLHELTVGDVQSWWDKQVTLPAKRGGTITPQTRTNRYNTLAACLTAAVDQGLIHESPAQVDQAGRKKQKKQLPLEYVPTPDDIACLVAQCNPRTGVAVMLAYYAGLRSGEIRALRVKDLHLNADSPYVRVDKGVARTASGAERVTTTKTTSSVRIVPCAPSLVDYLKQTLLQREGITPNSYVVENQHDPSVPVKGSALLEGVRGFHEAREASGLHPSVARLHDLRAAFLTRAGQQGATLQELMMLAGHTDPASALRYQVATQQRLKSIVETM